MLRFSLILVLVVLVTSCASKEDILYMQDIAAAQSQLTASVHETKIKPNDLLTIVVSADDPMTAAPFNLPITSSYLPNGPQINTAQQLQTYLVNDQGEISFPVLGTITIAGRERNEAVELLEKRLKEYIKNPIVNLRIVNYNISVLGEVAKPGNFTVQDEKVTVLEALSLAGDLTIYGKRDNILVVRDQGDSTKVNYRIDLTNSDFMRSPAYYLQQNDIVYVEPNKAQVQSSTYNRNTPVYISIASVLISLIVLITR